MVIQCVLFFLNIFDTLKKRVFTILLLSLTSRKKVEEMESRSYNRLNPNFFASRYLFAGFEWTQEPVNVSDDLLRRAIIR